MSVRHFIGGDAIMADPTLYQRYLARIHRLANGFISYIETPVENLGELKTSGLDLDVKASWPLGGWLAALDRFGSMPRTRVLAPAIDLAENGAPLTFTNVKFFEQSRLYDTTRLARFATVVFDPRTDGVVERFTVVRRSADQPTR